MEGNHTWCVMSLFNVPLPLLMRGAQILTLILFPLPSFVSRFLCNFKWERSKTWPLFGFRILQFLPDKSSAKFLSLTGQAASVSHENGTRTVYLWMILSTFSEREKLRHGYDVTNFQFWWRRRDPICQRINLSRRSDSKLPDQNNVQVQARSFSRETDSR